MVSEASLSASNSDTSIVLILHIFSSLTVR